MGSEPPQTVLQLMEEQLFPDVPFKHYPAVVEHSNAAGSSGADGIDWSSVKFVHSPKVALQTPAKALENVKLTDYRNVTVASLKPTWPTRHIFQNGVIPAPTSELTLALSVPLSRICVHNEPRCVPELRLRAYPFKYMRVNCYPKICSMYSYE